VHVLQIRCLDGVVGVKSIRDPMVTIVVSTSCYLHFVTYVLTLTAFYAISLYWRRLSSCIVPRLCSDVSLVVGGISCIVATLSVALPGAFSIALAAGLAGALAAALAAGLTSYTTSFSPCPSSATSSRGPWLLCRWRGCSDLLLE
jgi:hypothetical protein